MTSYKVKLVSQAHIIAFIILGLVWVFTEAALFFPLVDKTLAIPLVLAQFAVAIFIWQKFVTGWSAWKVDNDRITITWTKRFAFSEIKDFLFEWNDIERIWQGMDPQYYNLKFRFKDGETITFFHPSAASDDFDQLLTVLYQTLHDKRNLRPKTTERA